jgi:hypothetical protein
MKTCVVGKFLAAVALAMLVSGIAGAQALENNGCTINTLFGDYGFRISGQIYGPGGVVTQRDGVAKTHFDGAGHLTQADFVMSNGVPVGGPPNQAGFHIDETGTYTVYSDCTGTAEIDFPAPPGATSGAVIHLMFVLTNHGRTIHTIVSQLIPPGSTTPVPVSIHSDAEKLGRVPDFED